MVGGLSTASDQTGAPRTSGRLQDTGVLAALLLAVWATYSNALGGPFLFDDIESIVADPALRSWSTALDSAPGSGASGRPLVGLSLALNYALGGLEVVGYHVLNVALHSFTALALFVFVRLALAQLRGGVRTSGDRSCAFVAALLWGVHPLAGDAVNLVISRGVISMSFFYLVTLICAARGFASTQPRGWFIAAIAAACLAVASKETAVSLPFAVIIYDRALHSGSWRSALARHRALYMGFLVPLALLAWFVLGADRGVSVGLDMRVTPLAYALAQLEALTQYVRLAFWPDALLADYGNWGVWSGERAPWIAGLAVALLLVATAWGIAKKYLAGLAGFIFCAVLAPTTSFIPITGEVAAEHRMYLPLAALVVVVVLLGRTILGRLAPRLGAASALVGTVLLLTAGTFATTSFQRNRVWGEAVSFWTDVTEKAPRNLRAWHYLGDALLGEGRAVESVVAYERATEVNPAYLDAQVRLAFVLEHLGRRGEAAQRRAQVLTLDAGYASKLVAQANAVLSRGDGESGVRLLREALLYRPGHRMAGTHLVMVLATSSNPRVADPARAMELAADLLVDGPVSDPVELDAIAAAEARVGRFAEAVSAAQRAREIALESGRALLAEEVGRRLEFYRAGRPWQDPRF